jgi:PIN domain nuclease of toxin-antitoxin system
VTSVFDACAMIAYLRGEPGTDVVREILHDPANHCFAHAINLCEVYYDFVRTADIKTARAAISAIYSGYAWGNSKARFAKFR